MKYVELNAEAEYRIYGKEKGKKKFLPLDLEEGIFVKNLMYASMVKEKDVKRIIDKLSKHNPDIEFKAVKI